jgi:hypothetical protein
LNSMNIINSEKINLNNINKSVNLSNTSFNINKNKKKSNSEMKINTTSTENHQTNLNNLIKSNVEIKKPSSKPNIKNYIEEKIKLMSKNSVSNQNNTAKYIINLFISVNDFESYKNTLLEKFVSLKNGNIDDFKNNLKERIQYNKSSSKNKK